MQQTELVELENKYKKREDESLEEVLIPEGKYLAIRLDGFKGSKRYLKDHMVNQRYNNCLRITNDAIFKSFRHYLNQNYSSSIVCSYIVNDEISIILNKDNDHKYAKRIMKLCSLFAGSASSTFSLRYNTKNKKDSFVFDARPILLDEDEITEYIRHRYLFSVRYAYWKALRLDGVPNANDDDIFGNIDNAISLAIENNLKEEAEQLTSTYGFYMPEKALKPEYVSIEVNNQNMSSEKLHSTIQDYLTYLHSTPR